MGLSAPERMGREAFVYGRQISKSAKDARSALASLMAQVGRACMADPRANAEIARYEEQLVWAEIRCPALQKANWRTCHAIVLYF